MGVRQREGDKLCQLAQDRLNVTSFPNQQFPRGIMVSYNQSMYVLYPPPSNDLTSQLGFFYNMCGSKQWKDTGARRPGDTICCEVSSDMHAMFDRL